MKKTFFTFLFICLTFIFTSCSDLFDIVINVIDSTTEESDSEDQDDSESEAAETEDETTDPYLVTNDNYVYFVQVNNTSKDFSTKTAGYVKEKSKSSKKSREIEAEDCETSELEKNVTVSKKDENIPLVIQLNQSGLKYLQKNASREAQTYIDATVKDENRAVGTSYDFTIVNSNNEYESHSAVCKYIGEHCNVMFINNTALVQETDLDFKTIADFFDAIYEKETAIVGSNEYTSKIYTNLIDPVSKINVIVADIIETASKSQTSGTFGYFNSNDFFINGTYDYYDSTGKKSQFEISGSNETQCIYLDSYFLSIEPAQVHSTLVHEFNHLLNYCQKTVVYGNNSLSTWYTEMLSMICEDLFQNYLGIEDKDSPKNRLSAFNACYNYGFLNWTSTSDSDYLSNVVKNYAAAYAFGAYLVRNFGGVDLLKEMTLNQYVDENSVTEALKACGYSLTFDDALRYFPMILINTNIDGNSADYSSYITLNRKINDSSDEALYFDSVNLNDWSWYYYSDPDTLYYGPDFLTPGYTMEIKQSGISITKIAVKSNFTYSNYTYKYVNKSENPDFYTYFVNYNKVYN